MTRMKMNNIAITCPHCGSTIKLQAESVPVVQVPMKIDGQPFTGEIPYVDCPYCKKTITFEYN